MNEPRTNAGKALLDELAESPLDGARYAWTVVRRRVRAIEDEAVAAARASLVARPTMAAGTIVIEDDPRYGHTQPTRTEDS